MSAPTIYTTNLMLRPFAPSDAAEYARCIFSDPDVMRYMNADGVIPPAPLAYALKIISQREMEWRLRGYSAWALALRETGAFMGHVGFFLIDGTDIVEIGYALGKDYWGHGYATEAATAALRYAFTQTDLQQIAAIAFPENQASQRVMEKLGMQSQGITRAFYDLRLAHYTLTRTDYWDAQPEPSP